VDTGTSVEARVANRVTAIADFSYFVFAHFLCSCLRIFPAQVSSRDDIGRILKMLK
jgi:hypothetical protein